MLAMVYGEGKDAVKRTYSIAKVLLKKTGMACQAKYAFPCRDMFPTYEVH